MWIYLIHKSVYSWACHSEEIFPQTTLQYVINPILYEETCTCPCRCKSLVVALTSEKRGGTFRLQCASEWWIKQKITMFKTTFLFYKNLKKIYKNRIPHGCIVRSIKVHICSLYKCLLVFESKTKYLHINYRGSAKGHRHWTLTCTNIYMYSCNTIAI